MAGSEEIELSEIDIIAAKFAELHGAPKYIPRPKGSITVREYANYAEINEQAAWKWLNTLHQQGKADRVKFGRCWCYTLKEENE